MARGSAPRSVFLPSEVSSGIKAGVSYLERRNPVIKLAAVVLVALAVTFLFDPVTPLLIFLLTLVVGRVWGGLAVRAQLRSLGIFLVAGVAILLANILFNKENAVSRVVVSLGPLRVTTAALWAAGSLWFRLLCFALLSLVFVRTTSPQRLVLSLIHQLHLSYKAAYGTMVGYRMLPLLQSDYLTIRAAQRVRGIGEKTGLWHLWSRTRRYALPLLTGAVRRAGRVAVAMDARAFGAFPERTYRERIVVDRGDLWFLLVAIVATALIIVASWRLGLARFTIT